MRLEVYDEKKENDTVFLKLKKFRDGDIVLQSVNSDGKDLVMANDLLWIKQDGTFYRCKNVSSKIGFKLDKERRVLFNDNI